MATRTIRPKLYKVSTKAGQHFHVRALSSTRAKSYVIEQLEGALEVRAIHDDEAFQLGRDGIEILDATRED